MLHIQGESMINAGINNGDIVIARQAPSASNGQIVIALIENEATCKRFYKEKNHYRLQPENDSMDPILVPSVEILGVVIGLLRLF
ncbi:LexA repressor [bioreactor metagenome]|uniref:LexA repressor n=1 Tax=bioreactor metagenome TaxID=1076179 RepID=A0A645J882_9ZZZZ